MSCWDVCLFPGVIDLDGLQELMTKGTVQTSRTSQCFPEALLGLFRQSPGSCPSKSGGPKDLQMCYQLLSEIRECGEPFPQAVDAFCSSSLESQEDMVDYKMSLP